MEAGVEAAHGGPTLEISGREIGPGHPAYIVAEMSANHGGSFERAAEIVRAAKACGADAVKLQTYTADALTLDCDAPPFRVRMRGAWDGRVLHELYREAHTPWDWQPRLKEVADAAGIPLFSTPFDDASLAFLERLGVPAYKVASFELVDTPLIEKVARTGKPLILSTGMATLDEVGDAVAAARRGNPAAPLALLKCTSAYPAPPEEMNLRAIPRLAATFHAVAGLSDHTRGTAVAVAAVVLGAALIEKHLCLSRAAAGPDAAFSLEPAEFCDLVRQVRTAEAALGRADAGPGPVEAESRRYRRSLFVVRDVRAGEPFTERNVRSIRPADGLPPRCLAQVLGRRAARDVARGTPMSWELLGERG
ncbi:MAG TPA: pseudaminic acid synthase [Candidatus Binatia bacterium]|nr:pseudaminic acid synthase [Candidatus Binatia bacterium]